MVGQVFDGTFAHVAGTFNLAAETGSIDYVTPVHVATHAGAAPDQDLRLVGVDTNGNELFKRQLIAQRNSCAPHGDQGTFEAYIPVSTDLQRLSLFVKGKLAADFSRGAKQAKASITIGGLDPSSPHRFSLDIAKVQAPTPGVSYTVQAKDAAKPVWETIAVGLPHPMTEVDANQFPGAKSVSVRVLRSDGFAEDEVFNGVKHF